MNHTRSVPTRVVSAVLALLIAVAALFPLA